MRGWLGLILSLFFLFLDSDDILVLYKFPMALLGGTISRSSILSPFRIRTMVISLTRSVRYMGLSTVIASILGTCREAKILSRLFPFRTSIIFCHLRASKLGRDGCAARLGAS